MNDSVAPKLMQLVVWGPSGNSLVFVHASNIYYKSSVASNEIVQITNDGVFLLVSNGVPDWVYEGIEVVPIQKISER